MQRIFSAACWTVLVVSLHLTGIADRTGVTMADERADHRKQATRLFNEGQFAESLTLYQQLALDPQNPDRELPGDFAQSVRCLQQLGRISEFDSFIENVIKVHSEQWRLLLRASQMLSGEVETGGFLVGGQFERGHHRGGGEWADASERDRVRALQLLLQAVPLAEKDELATAAEKSDVYRQLANAIGMQRHGNAWKLQDLTDTTTLPDYSTSNPSPYGRGRRGRGFPGWGAEDKGAPVDADGNPVFHQMPTSWDAAKSDGERWRWALSQVVEKDASRQSEVDLEWAAFLNSQFGVREGFRDIILPASVAKDGASDASNTTTPEPADTHAAHRLPDDETIARLASGVRRFRLPDEFNPIVIFNRIVARGDASKRNAQESLIGIRMGRHQYPQAVEILRSLHEAATDKDDRANLQSRIDQIVKNWVQVDSVRVQPAGKGAVLNIRYRNGSQVNFEASEINIDQLLTDVKAYLQSRPKELNYERLQIENIGYLLLNQDRSRYLAKPSATWSAALKPPEGHFDATESVTTPLQKAGAWWVTAKMQDGNETRIVVWVADTAISRKRVEGGTMYFVADAATGTPVSKANLEFFGWNQQYNQEGRIHQINTTRFAAVTDENGISVPDASQLNSNFQWLTIAKTKEGRLAYEGFSGIWNPERLSDLDYSPVKVYSITDRPVYRPGHDVKFRLWIRQPRFHEDDARFDNKDYVIQIRNPRGDKVYETPARTDRWAGIDGEWKIPADGVLGDYVLAVCETANPDVSVIGNGSFRVEEYRKPEFEVKVDAPDKPVKLGEKIQAKINAKYYFGAPVTEGTVHYKVERSDKDSRWYPVAYWDWLYSPGYWWFAPDYQWYPGWNRWGCFAPIPPWRGWSPNPPEIVAEGDAELSEDGTFLVDIDTAAALRDHSDTDHSYSITAEVVDQSRRTIIGSGSVLVARDPFKVFVWTDRGHYQTGDTITAGFQARTPYGKPVTGKGKAQLLSVTWDGDKPVEKEVQAWEIETDAQGSGSLKMVIPKAGQYRISCTVSDGQEHTIEGGYVLTVRGQEADGRGYRFNDLELITEKREYRPGEKVSLQINTNLENSTVLLFVRSMNGLCPAPQVLRLEGKSTTHELVIERRDMPNIYVEALTIANGRMHTEVREIIVPPEQRVANVEVLPSAERYRPGEEATVRLKLSDVDGKPFRGNTVVSVYDASLEYIAASTIPEIRSFFWNVRRYHNVQNQSTLDRTSGPLQYPGEITMQPLFGDGPGMDANQNFWGMQGGFGGRGGMMPRSMMMRGRRNGMAGMPVPEAAMEADGVVGMGMDAAAAPAMEKSAGNAASGSGGETTVAEPTMRSNFADTAYWVASADSDVNGIVEIRFRVPDNLTTWKVKAWTMGDGTRVGSGSADLISSKDLIIRPQAPRFFTEKDQITVSAVVHNYLKTAKSTRVILESEGGQLLLPGNAEQTVEIEAGGEKRVDWNVQVIASGTTKVRMKALTDEESDATELSIPVHVHGMLKTESYTGVIRGNAESGTVTIRVPAERIEEQSRLEVRYSPSLAGAMVDALPYLIDYPYGCTEQTLNRFLPAVITQRTLQNMGIDLADVGKKRTNLNSQQLGDPAKRAADWKQYDRNPIFDDAEMQTIIRTGVQRLTDMQLSDGGWGWFSGYGEHSSAHLTAQVVHGLKLAMQNDVPVLEDVPQRGIQWLKNYQAEQLALLREGDRRRERDAERAKNPSGKFDDASRNIPFKMQADDLDAFVALVIAESDESDRAMSDYLYRDRGSLSVYAKSLTGLLLHQQADHERRDMLLRNIEQFLVRDDENQTAWLRMNENTWWYWYGSENEAMATYLKLLLAVRPNDETAPRLVKYLLNNRTHGTWWKSTRDTALVIESLADYIRATGEDQPDMTIEVLVDGVRQKQVRITPENFFSFDNVMLLSGDAVKSGEHKIEIRRTGKGPVYFSAYLTNFTKEDHITAAGLEVKVQRRFYLLERDDETVSVQGDRGQVVKQQSEKYKRIPLENLGTVSSGQLVEVELLLESKNDYEYLLLEDRKPSGFEPDDQRSGYIFEGLTAYRELRDDRVGFFLSHLARGNHSVSYRMRAEAPSEKVSALPAKIEGMYAPELVGNSDEMKLRVQDR